jgi:hypothetical protein
MTKVTRIRLCAFWCCAAIAGPIACQSLADQDRPIGCTGDVRPGIEVEIRDAVSGQPRADIARGIVTEGAFLDSLRPGTMLSTAPTDLLSRVAAHERSGTYEVHIQANGYRPWDTAGIVVRADVCHVITVRLKTTLVRSP